MADAADVARMTAIIERVRGYGVEVVEIDGWRTRGGTWSRTPVGIIDHHDASSRRAGEWGALGIITSGRAGLPGPLSQFQIARCLDGRPRLAVVAAGRANHAGSGGPRIGVPVNQGNSWLLGAEAANDGLGEPYTLAAHYAHDALFRACADICKFPIPHVIGHREWTSRKIDPRYDMNWRRAGVAGIVVKGGSVAGPAVPVRRKREHMLKDYHLSGKGHLRVIAPVGRASAMYGRGWVSAAVAGPKSGHIRVFFQNDNGGISDAQSPISFAHGHSHRWWGQLPDGCTQMNVQYDFPDGGVIALELEAK